MKKHYLFSDNKNYRTFVNARDLALEKMLKNLRVRITNITNKAFTDAFYRISSTYPRLFTLDRNVLHHLQRELLVVFDHAANNIAVEINSTRIKVHLFTIASEAEAISQVTGKKPVIKQKNVVSAELNDKSMVDTIRHNFDTIARNLITSVSKSIVMGDDLPKALGRCYKVLPKKMSIPSKKMLKPVKKITEADKPKRPKFSAFDPETDEGPVIGFSGSTISVGPRGGIKTDQFLFDDTTWGKVVDDILNDEMVVDRGPESVMDIQDPYTEEFIADRFAGQEVVYQWKVEQEVTNDFIQQVRSGQIDSANNNGIDEFVVISVVDDRTCEECCGDFGCVDFDGKLTSEVEEMTKGEQSAPPYHFKCRCTLAPASTDLESVDETQSKKDFDTWMNN